MARWGSLRRSFGRKVRWSALALTLAAASQLQADPPELKTLGNQIVVKGTNERVRLVGANLSGLEDGYDRNFLNSLDVLKGTWKANIIRLPVSDTLWFQSNTTAQDAYRQKVDDLITRAGQLDIYVVLDFHKYAIPTPAATTFWIDAANRYKLKTHVLFGLYNEPHTTTAKPLTWPLWRNGDSAGPGMQNLLQTVRAQGANNIVLVGGLDYAYDLRGIMPGYNGLPNGYALTDTASGNGVVYDSHVYPWKSYIQGTSANASLYYPFILGEFGHPSGTTVDFLPGKTFEAYPTWMPRMMHWINTNNFHWIGWNFSNGSDPAMLSDWSYTPSPHLGDFALSHMQSYADPTERRVVGGTVIGTPGTRNNPTSLVITDDKNGAVVPFSNTYAYFFNAATASDGWTGLDLGTATRITQIKYMPKQVTTSGLGAALMVGGVFEGSNSATFSPAVTLYTVPATPLANDTQKLFTEVNISDTGTYRYVRYKGPPGKYCNVASILFLTGDDSGPGVNDDVIIIDNGATGCTYTPASGGWANIYPSTGYHGSFWVHNGATGNGSTGAKSIRYTPKIMKAGNYEVFTMWHNGNPRCTAVPYKITYAGGASTTVYRDQNDDGWTWQSLGTYTFAADETGNVLLDTTNTTGYITADAMKFVYKPEVVAPIDMDKASTDGAGITSSGGWSATTTPTPYGNAYSYHDGNTHTGKWVRFTPQILTPGQYKVSVWWTQHANRATNTPITVYHTGVSKNYSRDQTSQGGQWNELPDTFTFAAGSNSATGSVLITNEGANGYVIVDAVRFVKVGN